jgi:formylglycine-generating enzyme required for sulfatase activity/CRP-like cAMP-binding protein/rhodanese-related sulfurtransferase/chromosome segregation ATPase
MSAATKHAAKKNLQNLVPLNALSEASFTEVSRKIVIEEVRSGHYLFRKGDHDNQAVYLLHGKIDLIDAHRKVTGEVEAGSDISRYPVANQQPRPLSARAVTKVIIARIDSILLDAFLNWDHTSVAEATEIHADDNEDWMTRILQSEAFIRIPPAVIQRLIMSMQPYPVRAGDVVIRQGEEGDFFYSIHKGRCAVTRRGSPEGKDQLLSELTAGDFFGEESLLSASTRNASITMLTDGLLMRLGKKDFVELLQKPLVKSVSYEDATAMVDEGAVWIDVRSAEEYACDAFEDSVNIPLTELRDQITELVFNAKYIICCDTGHRSISAAFVLSHKGFEAYVLAGGLNGLAADAEGRPHRGGPGSFGEFGNDIRRGAEVIDFNQNKEGRAEDNAAVTRKVRIARGEIEALSADHETELEALRGELDALRQKDLLRQEAENRLIEIEAELGALQEVIEESNRMVSSLQSQLENVTGENHLLQKQYDTSQKIHAEQLDRLEHELGQSTALVDSLRTEIAAAEQDRRRLRELLGSTEADRDARSARLEEDLSRLSQQRDELQVEFAAVSERASRLEEEHAAFRDEQRQLEESLRSDLAQAQLRTEALHAEMLQKMQQHGDSEASLREQLRRVEALSRDLAESRQEVEKLEAGIAVAREQQHTLGDSADGELAQRLEELESLRGELALARQHDSELAGRIAGEENKSRNLQLQLEELAASHEEQKAESSRQTEHLQQQLDAVSTEKQVLDEQLVSLQRDNDASRGEIERLLLQHKEQSVLVEHLTADRQAASEALVRLQVEWDAERAALKDGIEAGNKRLAELQVHFKQSDEEADRETLRLQEELQSRIDTYRKQLEQQDHHRTELQQEHARTTDALRSLQAERDDLQTRFDGYLQEGADQQRKIEELNALVDSLRGAADGQVQELTERLESERLRADEAVSQVSDQMLQLESLHAELSLQREKDTGLVVDIEVLQKQGEELREDMLQAEGRFRARDLENQEALKKLYEDLTRKNEAEKELQGQIERLRKKLDQSEEALQAARKDERESVENIRNELNAERRARAEERAQMAARQRELKEQLVSVASQHEEVIATRDGVVAQARDDAREEERTRLSQVIAMQQQTEQQLAALQDELRLAHEETASAVRQERASNEADLALARRQKADADAALGQFEIQLKQLMRERDEALAEQQSVRDQLNTLRTEVEVARGLMIAEKQGQAGDPIRLIAELKETRRNIEIAVRLRTEAEAQRDRAIAQLEELRHGQVKPGLTGNRSHGGTGTAEQVMTQHSSQTGGASQSVLNAGSASPGTRPAALPGMKAGHGRSVMAWVTGLGITLVAGFAFWNMSRMEILLGPNPDGAIVDSTAPAGTATDIPTGEQAVVKSRPTPGVGSLEVAPHSAAKQTSQQVPAATRGRAAVKPVTPVLAKLRSFRDALHDGGNGPVMVALPAASYLMGSAGNSLNFEERPQHPVDLPAYAIGKYEVSFAEYDRFAQATGRRLPHDEGWGRDDRPVVNVSWRDAEAYVRWLSEQTGHKYRLPSESQWEFAARADTTSAFWWDGVMSVNPANCFDCGSRWDGTRTAPVGSFQANKFGLHDTSGNAQEWTGDCYHPNYQNAPSDGSDWQLPGCTQRVVRGGSYTSPLDSVRSAKRGQYDQDTRLDNLGFRVVRVD